MVNRYDDLTFDDQARVTKLRDLAKRAPIDHDTVARVYGRALDPAFSDADRAGYMATWGLLAYEWAQGMLDADDVLIQEMIDGYPAPE